MLLRFVNLSIGRIPVAGGASAHGRLSGRQDRGDLLAGLGPGENETGDEADKDGGDTAKGDGGIEEDETADGDGKLVEGANHGVSGRGGDADTPRRAVRDEDGSETGVDHADEEGVAGLDGKVLDQVVVGPVLEEQGEDDQDGNGEKIIIEHG